MVELYTTPILGFFVVYGDRVYNFTPTDAPRDTFQDLARELLAKGDDASYDGTDSASFLEAESPEHPELLARVSAEGVLTFHGDIEFNPTNMMLFGPEVLRQHHKELAEKIKERDDKAREKALRLHLQRRTAWGTLLEDEEL